MRCLYYIHTRAHGHPTSIITYSCKALSHSRQNLPTNGRLQSERREKGRAASGDAQLVHDYRQWQSHHHILFLKYHFYFDIDTSSWSRPRTNSLCHPINSLLLLRWQDFSARWSSIIRVLRWSSSISSSVPLPSATVSWSLKLAGSMHVPFAFTVASLIEASSSKRHERQRLGRDDAVS